MNRMWSRLNTSQSGRSLFLHDGINWSDRSGEIVDDVAGRCKSAGTFELSDASFSVEKQVSPLRRQMLRLRSK
jgi:hypothetical protein